MVKGNCMYAKCNRVKKTNRTAKCEASELRTESTKATFVREERNRFDNLLG
jgi:hypothetical protein